MDSIFMFDSGSGPTTTHPRHSSGKKAQRSGDRRRSPIAGKSPQTADFFLLEGNHFEGSRLEGRHLEGRHLEGSHRDGIRARAYRKIVPIPGEPKVAPRSRPFKAPQSTPRKEREVRGKDIGQPSPEKKARTASLLAHFIAIPSRSLPIFARSSTLLRSKVGAAPKKQLLVIAGASLLIVLFSLGALALSTPRFPMPEGGIVRTIPSVQDDLLDFMTPELSNQVTETSLPPLPLSLATDTYTVTRGDTLGSIAAQNHVDIDTLVSMNNITSAKGLNIGQVLKIPNMRGIVHVVSKGENLATIAKTNNVLVSVIADANNLRSGTIIPGQALFIPGAHLSAAALRQVFGDMVIWPVKGIISSWFGYRPDPFTGVRRFHGGLDLAVPQGTPVKAAMDGRIADVGYNQMFGNYVIINHERGLQTLYGHLSRQDVHVGQAIAQGQILGLSGNTGYSTAPHLHFGVYRGGVSVNPLKYLPGSHP